MDRQNFGLLREFKYPAADALLSCTAFLVALESQLAGLSWGPLPFASSSSLLLLPVSQLQDSKIVLSTPGRSGGYRTQDAYMAVEDAQGLVQGRVPDAGGVESAEDEEREAEAAAEEGVLFERADPARQGRRGGRGGGAQLEVRLWVP